MINKLDFINRELIIEAAKQIDDQGVPEKRKPKGYQVQIDRKFYPFKFLINEV